MIVIEWGKYTAECMSVSETERIIQEQKINMQDATIKFRAKIPGVAFDELIKEIVACGGVIL